ncbi:hypothetical protein KTE19_00545 [Lentilactobacillus sp. IMAU92037]|uniref:hypothetical protein n=1 Tax=Lentilactobacillus TaxID=2767893 RepID=UPI001C2C99D4|nr:MULTISPECIES: hypothetical protein [Lentilactobacillus]MBV0929219.1 hypothetical protein [Lentilactobacillus dabitei]MDM7516168.1 hypothetical protein [Lentilactobacillus sp. TOM.63]
MPKTVKIDKPIKEYTATPEDKAEYEQGKARLMAAYKFMKAREDAGLTQRELATALGKKLDISLT